MIQRKLGWLVLLLITIWAGCTQDSTKNEKRTEKQASYTERILNQRNEKDSLFQQPSQSPLPTLTAIDTFAGLNYFPPDSMYRVKAFFRKATESDPFKMAATGEQQDVYVKYGTLQFTIRGKRLSLNLYQNLRLKDNEAYQDYLFIPFKDSTNGKSTYGGGRYLDFEVPESDTVMLDFNEAYNPYCAYSYEYSCPIPPAENHLPLAIKAGEKGF